MPHPALRLASPQVTGGEGGTADWGRSALGLLPAATSVHLLLLLRGGRRPGPQAVPRSGGSPALGRYLWAGPG